MELPCVVFPICLFGLRKEANMDKAYVSEFAIFIDHYLHDHPDIALDQHYGWDLFWKVQGDALRGDW